MEKITISHKDRYSRVYSYVKGSFYSLTDEDIDIENRDFLNNCLCEIRKFCPLLLDKISEELSKSGFNNISLVFSDEEGDGSSFHDLSEKASRIEILINLSKAYFSNGNLFSMVPH